MGNNRSLERRREKSSSGVNILYIIGGATIALVAAGVLFSLRDIKRYIRISSM